MSLVDSVQILPDGVDLVAGPSRIRVIALSPRVLRLRYAPEGSFSVNQPLAVLPEEFKDPIHVRVKQSADAVEFETAIIRVRILKSPLHILFLDLDGPRCRQ